MEKLGFDIFIEHGNFVMNKITREKKRGRARAH